MAHQMLECVETLEKQRATKIYIQGIQKVPTAPSLFYHDGLTTKRTETSCIVCSSVSYRSNSPVRRSLNLSAAVATMQGWGLRFR